MTFVYQLMLYVRSVFGRSESQCSVGVATQEAGIGAGCLVGGRGRLDAVRAVLANGSPGEVAAQVGVSRQTLHTWTARYLTEGVAGLADRSHRPKSCPHQVSTAVEVAVAELRRSHPRWSAKRIRMELLRKPVDGVTVPSVATINRSLCRQGLARQRPRRRPRDSYVRYERRAGVRIVGMHDFRHGCVSVLLGLGVPPRTAMDIVGHSTIEMTMNVYGHVSLDDKRDALDKLGTLFEED